MVNPPAIQKSTLLWRIRTGDAQPASYLFGTMHATFPVAFQRIDAVHRAIDHCAAFAAEFAFDDPSLPLSHTFGMLPTEHPLNSLLPPKRYARLRQTILRYAKLDIHPLRHLSPMLLTQLIDQRISGADLFDGPALDLSLWEFAQTAGKQLFGIETLEEQVQVLQKIPIEIQLQGLLRMSRNIPGARRFTQHLLELYGRGNPQAIYLATRRRSGASRKSLLIDRNQIMAARIAQFVYQQTTFCAIGAAHLGGNQGVLRLLKARGFKLEGI